MENLMNIINKHNMNAHELAEIIYVYLDLYGGDAELKEEIFEAYLSEQNYN